MVWVTKRNGWQLQGARGSVLRCPKCGNTAEQIVWVNPAGLQLGFVLSKKCLSTSKQYFLACPVCGSFNTELTREQAHALRESA